MYFYEEVWRLPREVDRITTGVINQVTAEHAAMVGPLGPVVSDLVKAGIDCQIAALRMTRLLRVVESTMAGLEKIDD